MTSARLPSLAALVFAMSFNLSSGATSPEDRKRAQNDDPCTPAGPDYTIPAACAQQPRVQPYEPIYAIYQHTQGDENAFRLHYSLRYVLFTPDCLSAYESGLKRARTETERRAAIEEMGRCTGEYARQRHEIYLMYTGQFDFYMDTRDSGPVVNRISNPGIHFRQYVGKDLGRMRWSWWDIGVEHRSDGQTTDPHDRVTDPASPNFGRYRAQVEYERNNHPYLDSISQDTNYVTVEAKFELGRSLEIWTRVKPFYFANDTAVTWGPRAGADVAMADYDRVRLLLSYRLGERTENLARQRRLYADWVLGDKGFNTDSFNVGLYWPFSFLGMNIPLYARAHYGPLHTLSDFTKKQNSFGVGVLLLP